MPSGAVASSESALLRLDLPSLGHVPACSLEPSTVSSVLMAPPFELASDFLDSEDLFRDQGRPLPYRQCEYSRALSASW